MCVCIKSHFLSTLGEEREGMLSYSFPLLEQVFEKILVNAIIFICSTHEIHDISIHFLKFLHVLSRFIHILMCA